MVPPFSHLYLAVGEIYPRLANSCVPVMRHNRRVEGFMLHCNEMKMVRHLCQPTNRVKVLYKTNF